MGNFANRRIAFHSPVPLSNGKGGPIRPQASGPDRPLTRTRLRVLDDMQGRNDLRHLGHLHGSSPPFSDRPQPCMPGGAIYGREILSEVDSLREAEIPREGALCSAATDYLEFK
jgi:hypothetical protein